MDAELLNQNADAAASADTGADENASLEAAWSAMDHSDDGDGAVTVDRDEAGRFKAKDGDAPAEPDTAKPEGEQQQEEIVVSKVTLPGNMTPDMADIFEGMAPEKATKLTAWADKLHRQMSDQGRALKPFNDVVGAYPEYFTVQGNPPPPDAFNRMMAVQKQLDTDPIAGLRMIADAYGVTDKVFGGQSAMSDETAQLRQTISELKSQLAQVASPQAIRSQIENTLQERTALDEVSRFAQSKPLYADVEAVMPRFVELAKDQLGGNAGITAILDRAYDMAVYALPETRAKQQAAKPAADADAKRVEAAKKATAVNVKSAPGKAAPLSDDEAMEAAWNRMHA